MKQTKLFRSLLAILFLSGISFGANATHLVGGQITYTFTSGSTYHIKLSVYRDCEGISLGSSKTIDVTNATTGGGVTSFIVNVVNVIERTTLCPGQQSTCTNPNSIIEGVEEHIFEGDVTLPTAVEGYTLSWSENARANGVTNLVNPGSQSMYFTTFLQHNPSLQNNSPIFLNPSLPNFCIGQPATLSLNATDADGDQIVYSLVNSRQLAGVDVNYQAGLSGTTPIVASTPVSLNSISGAITFTPSVAGQRAVFAIRAEEFRGGIKIGEIYRDFEVRTSSCTNNTPVIAPVANVVVAVGATICIPISVTDADNDMITLSALSGILPPGTFTINNAVAGSTTATLCFTAGAGNAGQTYAVTLTGNDNACPAPAVATGNFTITVPGATVPTISEWGLIILCLILLSIGMIFIYKKENVFSFGKN